LRQDYVRTARGKGVLERNVIVTHSLRNALIPLITIIGVEFGYLLGGAVIVENVFALPGIGRLIINGIDQRDYAVVQGTVLFVAICFVLINLLVDIIYAYSDPRIRYE
jgi:peptide/nickel transport system permease protein